MSPPTNEDVKRRTRFFYVSKCKGDVPDFPKEAKTWEGYKTNNLIRTSNRNKKRPHNETTQETPVTTTASPPIASTLNVLAAAAVQVSPDYVARMEYMETFNFWDQPQIAKLFNGDPAIPGHTKEQLQSWVESLQKVLNNGEQLEKLVNKAEDHPLNHKQTAEMLQKIQLLFLAYSTALCDMPGRTWVNCCTEAIAKLHRLGLASVKNHQTVMAWNRYFRVNRVLPHPNTAVELDKEYTPKIFACFPEAKSKFVAWVNKNIATLSSERAAEFIRNELIPELHKQESAHLLVGDVVSEEEFKKELGLKKVDATTALRWLKRFGFSFSENKKEAKTWAQHQTNNLIRNRKQRPQSETQETPATPSPSAAASPPAIAPTPNVAAAAEVQVSPTMVEAHKDRGDARMEYMETYNFWDQPQIAKLFNGDPAIPGHTKEQLESWAESLQNVANNGEELEKFVNKAEDHPLDHKQTAEMLQKIQLLYLAYSTALCDMPGRTWIYCCTEAIAKLHRLGLASVVKSHRTVMAWNMYFRVNRVLPHPNIAVELDKEYTPKIFACFPEAKSKFIAWANKNIATLSSERAAEFIRNELIPELHKKQESAHLLVGEVVSEEEFKEELGLKKVDATTALRWLKCFGFSLSRKRKTWNPENQEASWKQSSQA